MKQTLELEADLLDQNVNELEFETTLSCAAQTPANCTLNHHVKNDGLARKIIILASLLDMQTMFAKCCCTTYAETNKSAMLYAN